MQSCKEISQLISESLDRPLNWRERFSLWLHNLRCDMCSRYAKQLKFLNNTFADAGLEQSTAQTSLDEAVRERIRDHINQTR